MLISALVPGSPAAAGSLTAVVTDSAGQPLPRAVVALGSDAPAAAPAGPAQVIDQKNETFVPDLVVVPTGGSVVFRNSDSPRHQVYSFSAAKRFERELAPGEESDPILFDKPGVVALGCNIHDHMVAYVYVAPGPHVGMTDQEGRATLAGVPDGPYTLQVWHPRQRPGGSPPGSVTVAGSSEVRVAMSLAPPRPTGRDAERAPY